MVHTLGIPIKQLLLIQNKNRNLGPHPTRNLAHSTTSSTNVLLSIISNVILETFLLSISSLYHSLPFWKISTTIHSFFHTTLKNDSKTGKSILHSVFQDSWGLVKQNESISVNFGSPTSMAKLLLSFSIFRPRYHICRVFCPTICSPQFCSIPHSPTNFPRLQLQNNQNFLENTQLYRARSSVPRTRAYLREINTICWMN